MIPLSDGPIQSTDEMVERAEHYGGGLSEVFQYLKDHVDDFETGDISPEDLPEVSEEAGAVMMASVMFGILWEREYPTNDPVEIRHRLAHDLVLAGKHGVLDNEDAILELVEKRAKESKQNLQSE